MKRLALYNGAAFAFALAASTGAVWAVQHGSSLAVRSGGAAEGAAAAAVRPSELRDPAGTVVPLRDYRRIVSASTVADGILLEISEPDRVIGVTAYSAQKSDQRFRFAGRPVVEHLEDPERILAMHPDLVLVSSVGDPRPVARLRDAGLVVFDLGEMRGLSTLVRNIHEIAELLGHPERGARFAQAIVEQMGAVAADVPLSERRRAIYLSAYGGILFGGGPGTSYHDVLVAAGLVDAASAYRDWPQYTSEQVLTLDPDVIVTSAGMRPRICQHAGLANLRACRGEAGIVEVDGALMGDPGPSMVDAARAIRAIVHGQPSATELTMKGPSHE